MKVYVTFDEEQVITIRGIVFDKDCIAELDLDIEGRHDRYDSKDVEQEVFYIFGCYKEVYMYNPPTDRHYSRGVIAAN